MTGALLVLALAAASLLAVGAGIAVRTRGWSDWWAVLAILAGAAVTVAVVAGWRDPEAPDDAFVRGLAIGALGLWVVPVGAYYALGRFVRHRIALGAVWLFSLPVLGYWLFLALIFTADKVSCAPDAYECPL